MVEENAEKSSFFAGGLRQLMDWPARRRRRKLKRNFPAWAAANAAFVRRGGLAGVCFQKDGQIIIEAEYGVRLKYVPEIKRSAMDVEHGGVWERQETELVLNRLADGCVFFDIGANCGWFSLVAARQLPQITVHAFEPVPQTFELLTGNIELNGLDNITANNVGLWDENKQLRFTSYRGPKNYITDTDDERTVVVDCISLDDYIEKNEIDRLDFIKCDVEGAELHFLRGAEKCLRRFAPALLLETQERYAARFGNTPTDVIAFLAEMGYKYDVVTEDKGPVPQSGNVGRDLSLGRDFLFTKT